MKLVQNFLTGVQTLLGEKDSVTITIKKLLIPYQNGVRLPEEIEREIPVDTTMLKNRIANTERLMKYSNKYKYNEFI
jgi:hypothetical protein